MLLNPAILALLISSILMGLLVAAGAFFGVRVLRSWDLKSGSELQLSLEKSTYLISTFLTVAFVFQMASFFLFIATAENLHTLFVGAMCAAGTLNINPYGYPTLIMKTIVFMMAGLWLVLNHADNLSPLYPLIRIKYGLLLCIVPFAIAEAVFLWRYMLGMEADIITSCCGTLFSVGNRNVLSGLDISLRGIPARETFWTISGLTCGAGFFNLISRKGGVFYALMSIVSFVVAYYGLVVFISPFIYELPNHHCPFCLLQREYNYIGYIFFVLLMTGTICGTGGGLLHLSIKIPGLERIAPSLARRFVMISLIGFILFLTIVCYAILNSNLRVS